MIDNLYRKAPQTGDKINTRTYGAMTVESASQDGRVLTAVSDRSARYKQMGRAENEWWLMAAPVPEDGSGWYVADRWHRESGNPYMYKDDTRRGDLFVCETGGDAHPFVVGTVASVRRGWPGGYVAFAGGRYPFRADDHSPRWGSVHAEQFRDLGATLAALAEVPDFEAALTLIRAHAVHKARFCTFEGVREPRDAFTQAPAGV